MYLLRQMITFKMINVTGSGIDSTLLQGTNGQYFARVRFTGETSS